MTDKDESLSKDFVERNVENLKMLTDAERMEVFSHFCTHCGCINEGSRKCQCWNDD